MTTTLKPISRAKNATHAVFGVSLSGEAWTMCLSDGPHWLICGETGSGKSVFINQIIISMMFHSTPEDLNIALIDPKGVEFEPYKGSPFLVSPPITNMNDAYGLLIYLVQLMEERYTLMKQVGVRNLEGYNKKCAENGREPFAYVVVFVDEFSDLIMQNEEVETPIVRLAQKSRACGIHVCIATQRPDITVITGKIKANIPSRIGLKTTDANNSRIILDEDGCEKLRGYGDALVKTRNGITRMQGPFIEDDELARILARFKQDYEPTPQIDYKTAVVESGDCEWAEEYADDVPMEERHVKKTKKRRFGGF